MDNMVQLLREEKGRIRDMVRTDKVGGQEEEAEMLWGIMYASDAGIAPRTLQGMVTVMVTACAAFGLTLSEAKMEIMCPRTKWHGESGVHCRGSRPGLQ